MRNGKGFRALVLFDPLDGVVISLGGYLGADDVDELCELVERSRAITGRRTRVDLAGARVADDAAALLTRRCAGIAAIALPAALTHDAMTA